MSSDMSNPILWAHYANGFKGICIEFEVNTDIVHTNKIKYAPSTPHIDDNRITEDGVFSFESFCSLEPIQWAEKILLNKFEEWEYEKEVRLFSNQIFIQSGIKIKSIFLGPRITENFRTIVEKIANKDIKINTTIDRNNHVIPKTNTTNNTTPPSSKIRLK